MASVHPINPGAGDARQSAVVREIPVLAATSPTAGPATAGPRPRTATRAAPPPAMAAPRAPGTTLDASWDRKLASGAIAPDCSIDLHGHTLDTAYHQLDDGLDRAIARGDRVLLLITGRPPRAESERPHARGRIRAAVGDWLAASRHAANIAAVRGAHPRHGGAGALYIILRRPRSGPKY